MKFKKIIMIAAALFAIVPMAIYAAFTTMSLESNGEAEFKNEITALTANQAAPLGALISGAKSDVEFLAGADSVKKAGAAGSSNTDADELLKNFASENPLVVGAKLVNSSGKVVCGTDSGSTVTNYAGYASYADGALYFDEAAGKATDGSTMVIKKAVGSCAVFVSYDIASDASVVARICDNARDRSGDMFYKEGNVRIFDANGNWSSGKGYFKKDIIDSDIRSKLDSAPEGNNLGIFTYTDDKDGTAYTADMIRVGGDTGLTAVVTCPSIKAVQYPRGTTTPIIVLAIVLGVIGIVAAIIVSGVLTGPMKKIQRTLDIIKNGDHEARISNMTSNEYGQLSRAFNNLVDDIVVSEDRYRNISEMSDNIIFEWNFKTNEVVFSNNFNKKFSYRAPSNHFGDSFLLKAKVHPDDIDRYRQDLDGLEKGRNFERNEYRIKNIYGDFIWVLMRTATLKGNDDKPVKAVGVMVDIDRGKKSEQQLTERASYDALTELYNRETIENQIDNEISLSEMRKSEMAVLFIDVDDFKHYNDNYSHATGDQVLKFLAKTIKSEVDGIGFAGRYGGDEFIVLLRNAEENDPAVVAKKIIDKLSLGFDADIGERLTVSVSIGIALIKDDYNTRVEYLIGKADDAMYSVKKSGKSNFAFIN